MRRIESWAALCYSGVPLFVEPHGRSFRTMADLGRIEGVSELGLDLYLGGRLYRQKDAALCRSLLAAVRRGCLADGVRAFHALLDQARDLIPTPATTP